MSLEAEVVSMWTAWDSTEHRYVYPLHTVYIIADELKVQPTTVFDILIGSGCLNKRRRRQGDDLIAESLMIEEMRRKGQ